MLVLGDSVLLDTLRCTLESSPHDGRVVELIDVSRIGDLATDAVTPGCAPGGLIGMLF